MRSHLMQLPSSTRCRLDADKMRQRRLTSDNSSQRDATSPLLRLPAELRNHIFALALAHGEITWDQGAWPKNVANLLFVCRQTYAETALLPYSLNSFVFLTISVQSIGNFLKRRTPAQIEHIHDLSCEYVGSRTSYGYLRFPATNWMATLQI